MILSKPMVVLLHNVYW